MDNLTEREWQVVELIARGWRNQRISRHLGLALQTVNNRVSRIYRKTGLSNRVQLANLWKQSQE